MGRFQFGGFQRWLLYSLAVADSLVLFAAPYLAAGLRFGTTIEIWPDNTVMPLWPKALVFALVGMVALISTGLYNQRLRDGLSGMSVRVVVALVFQGLTLALLFYAAPQLELGRGLLAIALGVAFVALVLLRIAYIAASGRGHNQRRVLVLGAGRHAAHLLRFRRRTDFIGIEFVGFRACDGDHQCDEFPVPDRLHVSADEPLNRQVERLDVDQVVVAVDDRRTGLTMEDLLACRTQGVDVVELVGFIERELGLLKLDVMSPAWLVFSPGFNKRVLRRWMKRLFDITVSLTLLVLASPVMLAAAAINWIEGRGRWPILYRQIRVGEEGIPFELMKFRSMRPDAEAAGGAQWAQENDPRITRFGRILRKYRIDELPQLINILSGRMSFVGPRPERPEFVGDLARDLPYYAERHRVKPGLTGWAQIRYPYGSSIEDARQKLQFDLYYAKNHSMFLDFVIMLQTAEVVIRGKGAR